jgi:alkanesulfonate monooxygenase SsuD/methylene tetrahydromethanopterin reductase-like flavin-dependent oxidoreductase (luciferase family)
VTVHFGVTGCFGGLDGLTLDERVDLLQEAERLGYESIWLNEEHFVSESRFCLSPIPLASYLAGRTEKLRLGFSVLQLPLHNPLRLAEDIATLDVLSGGRVDFGVSRSGLPRYHEGFGNPIEERTERFAEGLELVQKFWTSEEPVSHQGKFHQYENVILSPKPVQKPHPPIYIGARDPASVRRVASGGYRLIEGVVQALSYTIEDVAAFREGARESGRILGPEDVTIGRYVFVAETDAKAREESREGLAALAKSFHTSGHIQRGFVVDESQLEADRFEREFAVVGSPDTCAARIEELREALRFGRFNCGFGVLGHGTRDGVQRSLRLFGREVIPRFAS